MEASGVVVHNQGQSLVSLGGNIVTLPHRRQFLHLAAGAAASPALSRIARAQSYPTRPITIIVPYPAGGGADAVARIMAERMRAVLGQPIIIENVAGASGSIGTGRVARAAPDGYTLGIGNWSTHVVNGAIYSYCVIILRRDLCVRAFAPQHGHRGNVLTSASINRMRMVAIEFGIWRSGRKGGSSGSITVG